jgi:hypothetical protein
MLRHNAPHTSLPYNHPPITITECHRMPKPMPNRRVAPRGVANLVCAFWQGLRFDHRCQSASALAALCVCRTRHYSLIGTLKASHARSSRTIPSGRCPVLPQTIGCIVACHQQGQSVSSNRVGPELLCAADVTSGALHAQVGSSQQLSPISGSPSKGQHAPSSSIYVCCVACD